MSKADKMLSILWQLRARQRVTAKQLAESLEIHVRSVYRYIDALCASGVPIVAEAGPNGGYTLLPTFRESPLFFDLEEQKALVHAAAFARENGYPFGEALDRAIGKLKRYANEEQQETLARHAAGLDVIAGAGGEDIGEMLQRIETAVADSRTIRIVYVKGYAGPTETRDVDPYGLVVWRSRWYVVGYCRLRQAVRSFRTDRIQSCETTEDGFVRPADFSAREFFMKFLLPEGGGPDDESFVTVRLRGTARAIDDVCLHWLFSQSLAERTGKEAVFRMDAQWVRHYVPYTLIAYGTSIAVVEPLSLVEDVFSVLDRLRPHYENMRGDLAGR
ncbi:YafY family protein [Paenibacillus sp.]|uniref:helix-turn-helix transcriptional regulator n=1 Tax=Paenibacillus sp. TaxID=58172 RepID=UPI0028120612|nr:YafY family protein [Paenibacillus sp.]